VRITIRGALAFGKPLYDERVALGLSVADLAQQAGMTADDIECIEDGGTEPTVAMARRLAAALDADVHLTAGHDLGSVWFAHSPILTKTQSRARTIHPAHCMHLHRHPVYATMMVGCQLVTKHGGSRSASSQSRRSG
jgi:transcriptional regulator with XRE-family HTH domain